MLVFYPVVPGQAVAHAVPFAWTALSSTLQLATLLSSPRLQPRCHLLGWYLWYGLSLEDLTSAAISHCGTLKQCVLVSTMWKVEEKNVSVFCPLL